MKNQEFIILQIELPVPVKDLALLIKKLTKMHPKESLLLRQVGQVIQLYRPET